MTVMAVVVVGLVVAANGGDAVHYYGRFCCIWVVYQFGQVACYPGSRVFNE